MLQRSEQIMDFKKALELAREYYLQEGIEELLEAYDAGDTWIFFGGIKGKPEIGSYGISIKKETGTVSDFILPSRKNFEILDNAKEVNID